MLAVQFVGVTILALYSGFNKHTSPFQVRQLHTEVLLRGSYSSLRFRSSPKPMTWTRGEYANQTDAPIAPPTSSACPAVTGQSVMISLDPTVTPSGEEAAYHRGESPTPASQPFKPDVISGVTARSHHCIYRSPPDVQPTTHVSASVTPGLSQGQCQGIASLWPCSRGGVGGVNGTNSSTYTHD